MLRGLVLAAAAAASTHTIDVPQTLHSQIESAKKHTTVRILLPKTLQAARAKTYPTGGGTKSGWDMELGYVKNCGGADACFFADFTGKRTKTKPDGDKKVTLAHGLHGMFISTHCGGSCSPPQVQWREHGALYTMQIRLEVSSKGEQKAMIAVANQAIRGGAR